jgi:hypothetical protein
VPQLVSAGFGTTLVDQIEERCHAGPTLGAVAGCGSGSGRIDHLVGMFAAMTNSEDNTDEYLIYIGYGEVMRRLQILELGLWGLLSRKIKPGTSLGQAMEMVAKWDGTAFGQLMRGMKNQSHWPEGLLDKLLEAVNVRNYLAHHFLREYFMAAPPGRTSRTPQISWLSCRSGLRNSTRNWTPTWSHWASRRRQHWMTRPRPLLKPCGRRGGSAS